jgi:hypothetical protein
MSTITASQRFASVWGAIEDSREVAASLKLKAEVASAVIDEIRPPPTHAGPRSGTLRRDPATDLRPDAWPPRFVLARRTDRHASVSTRVTIRRRSAV